MRFLREKGLFILIVFFLVCLYEGNSVAYYGNITNTTANLGNYLGNYYSFPTNTFSGLRNLYGTGNSNFSFGPASITNTTDTFWNMDFYNRLTPWNSMSTFSNFGGLSGGLRGLYGSGLYGGYSQFGGLGVLYGGLNRPSLFGGAYPSVHRAIWAGLGSQNGGMPGYGGMGGLFNSRLFWPTLF